MKDIVKVGILGLGTVGSGVVKSLKPFTNIIIKKVSVKNLDKKRSVELAQGILTTDSMSVVNDPEIDVVVELIGGISPAYDLIKAALQNKKHVVSANKELIAKHGKELFELAQKNDVVLLYEAAVAGGIPVVMPLKTALSGNKIKKIQGILNGTTNYIITKMTNEGASFEDVLREAQELGYAEADPTGDVQGYDAMYKIAILASIAFGKRVNVEGVYREGIDKIKPLDIACAAELGYKIKLIAQAQDMGEQGVDIRVHPMLVAKNHPMANIDDVLNAVVIEGNPVGQITLSGPGAGEMPTASSVVGDLVSLATEMKVTDRPLPMMRCNHNDYATLMDISDTRNKYFINVVTKNNPGVIGSLGVVFGLNHISLSSLIQRGVLPDGTARIVLLTEEAKESDFNKALLDLKNDNNVKEVVSVIRVS
ncbi:MAG: homoserine dehydrogenase [bacterium]